MAIVTTSLRMTGMYSGLDTDALVKAMMQIEQLKLDRQNRSLTTLQWKQEQYQDVNDTLKTFMNDYISVLGSNTMMNSSNYITFKATVSGANADAVTVTGTSEAYAGNLQIDQVVQLATSSKAESASKVSAGGELAESNSTALKDLDFDTPLEFENGEISFSINGVEFTFSEDDTLQTMMNTINASDAGVNMVYSRLTDTISFEAKDTGSDGVVEIVNIKGNAFGAGGAFGIDNGKYENGENAKVIINGIEVERQSNTFTIDGITYTLNRTTEATDSPIYVKLEQDVDAAVDSIKQFVEGYNTMIAKLTEMTETRKSSSDKSYTALTDEEKESMTQEQIDAWEEIAKTGLLYNDAGIQGLLSGLRSALYEPIEGVGVSMADLGFRTNSYDITSTTADGASMKGQIILDEDILRQALEDDPHQVMSAFMNISDSTDPDTQYKENGFLYRVNNLMNEYVKGSGQNSIDALETSIYNTNKKISDMEDRMLELEERLYLKYAALEEALAQLESQSNYITMMMGM